MLAEREAVGQLCYRLLTLIPDRVRADDADTDEPVNGTSLLILLERTRLLVADERSSLAAPRRFSYQMFQEVLASRAMLDRWRTTVDLSPLWRAPRRHAEMPDPKVGEWDPLPESPDNGWQQTTILAAGLVAGPTAVRTT